MDFLIAAVAIMGVGGFVAAMGHGVKIIPADPHVEFLH
jgi:hypothetical protein